MADSCTCSRSSKQTAMEAEAAISGKQAKIRPKKRKLLEIVFPGKVNDHQKALQALGGLEALHAAVNSREGLVKLHLHPEQSQPWQLPLHGDVDKMCHRNALLHVKRPRGAEEGEPQIDVQGVVQSRVVFGGLADFQLTGKRARGASVDYPSFVPNMFYRFDRPLNYQFREGQRMLMKDASKNTRPEKWQIKWDAQVPHFQHVKEPQWSQTELDCKRLVQLKFLQQRIWSAAALFDTLPDTVTFDVLWRVLPFVAYRFSNGPWRQLWIKFGYDPRTDRSAMQYQVVEIRVKEEEGKAYNVSTSRFSNAASAPFRFHRTGEGISEKSIRPDPRFQRAPNRRAVSYMLAEVHSRTIRDIIRFRGPQNARALVRSETCTKTHGWLTKQAWDRIRVAMNLRKDRLFRRENGEDATDVSDVDDTQEPGPDDEPAVAAQDAHRPKPDQTGLGGPTLLPAPKPGERADSSTHTLDISTAVEGVEEEDSAEEEEDEDEDEDEDAFEVFGDESEDSAG